MNNIDKKVEAVNALQAEPDHKTEIENQAIRLISECKFQEADNLFHSLNDSIVKDEWNAIIRKEE